MAKKSTGSSKQYRSAITGHYVKKSTAIAHPRTTVAETRKKPK